MQSRTQRCQSPPHLRHLAAKQVPAQSSHLPAIGRGGEGGGCLGGGQVPPRPQTPPNLANSPNIAPALQMHTPPKMARTMYVSTTLPDKKWDTSPACNKTIIHPMTPTTPLTPQSGHPPTPPTASTCLAPPHIRPPLPPPLLGPSLHPHTYYTQPSKHLSVPPTSIL